MQGRPSRNLDSIEYDLVSQLRIAAIHCPVPLPEKIICGGQAWHGFAAFDFWYSYRALNSHSLMLVPIVHTYHHHVYYTR